MAFSLNIATEKFRALNFYIFIMLETTYRRDMDLAWYLEVMKISQTQFAKLTGIAPPRINSYVRKLSTPSLEKAMQIHDITQGMVRFKDMIRNSKENSEEDKN